MKFKYLTSYRPLMDADNEGAGGGSDANVEAEAKAKQEAEAKEKQEAEAKRKADEERNKPSDKEAELLREVMKRKDNEKKLADANKALEEKLKVFDGLDPEAARAAVQAAKDAEEKKLAEKGEWDRLKNSLVEQHTKEVTAVKAALSEKEKAIGDLNTKIDDLTIGNAFGNSSFIQERLILSPAKTRVLFGAHFELKDNAIVAYDKPKGASERTLLVDAKGDPLSFDAAIEKLVQSDPDAPRIVKSNMKPGTGAGNEQGTGGTRVTTASKPTSTHSKIAEGLKGLATVR